MSTTTIRWPVWDWPVRVIHWYFPVAIAFMWWSGEEGAMEWHSWVGYSLIVAVVTRLLWGLWGSRHARFADFLRGPSTVLAYLRGAPHTGVGHNPLGGWSTLGLLSLILSQGLSGLCANDDIVFEGPLAYWAGDWSPTLTEWHEINWALLQLFIAVHLGAIGYYRVMRKQRLVAVMLRGSSEERYAEQRPVPARWALLSALAVSAALAAVVYWAPEAPSYY